MPKPPSLSEMRERLRLQKAINRELERTARLEERIARARGRPSSMVSAGRRRAPSRTTAAKRTRPRKEPRPKKSARRPSKSRAFEALHPRGPGGKFAKKAPAQAAQPAPLRRWALFLRPAYGKKVYPNEVIILVLGEDPSLMTSEARGAWLRAIRKARRQEDDRVRWVVEQGSGPWLDPTVAPGTWWVERRENLN